MGLYDHWISNQTIAYFIQPLILKAEHAGPPGPAPGADNFADWSQKLHENRPVILLNMSDPPTI